MTRDGSEQLGGLRNIARQLSFLKDAQRTERPRTSSSASTARALAVPVDGRLAGRVVVVTLQGGVHRRVGIRISL